MNKNNNQKQDLPNNAKQLFKDCKKKTITYYVVSDYDLLKKLDGNRETNPKHIKTLKTVAEQELLKNPDFMFTVECNEHGEVLDGQHSLQASKELGIPVRVEIKEGEGLAYTHSINTNVLTWNVEGLVTSIIDTTPELLYLNDLAKKLETTTFNAVRTIVSLKDRKHIGIKLNRLKGFTADTFYNRSKKIMEVVHIITGNFYDTKTVSMEVLKVAQSVINSKMDLEKLQEKLSTNPIKLNNSEKFMRKDISERYNHKSRGNYIELNRVTKYDAPEILEKISIEKKELAKIKKAQKDKEAQEEKTRKEQGEKDRKEKLISMRITEKV